MIPLVTFLSAVALGRLFSYFPYSTVLISIIVIGIFAVRKRFMLVSVMVLGLLYPAFIAPPAEVTFPEEKTVKVEGHFTSPAVKRSSGYWQEFRTEEQDFSVLSKREMEIGRHYTLSIRPVVPKPRQNPGSWEGAPFGVMGWVVKKGDLKNSVSLFFNRLRERLNGAIRDRFPQDEAAFIMAVTTGHRGEMSRELRDGFSRAGVAHLLSISGTHLGLFSLLLFGIFRFAIKHLPIRMLERVTMHLTPSQGAALLTLPFMLFYLGISGARIPTIRSFIMVGLFMVGLLLGRKGAWLNFLLLAAVLLVLLDPAVLGSLSFQLSFTAVLFIGWGFTLRHEAFGEGEPVPGNRALEYVKRTFLVTLFATFGVAPLVAYYFHYVSLISPATNFIVTPLVCFLMVPLSLVGAFSFLVTGHFVTAYPVELLSKLSISLVNAFTSVPHSSVPVRQFPIILLLLYYAGFLLYWMTRRRETLSIAFLPLMAYIVFSTFTPRPLSVTFLDAGQGHASVIELPDDRVIAVDAGRSGRELAYYLEDQGHESVDALVITHPGSRHTKGIERLMENISVREIWKSGAMPLPSGLADGVPKKDLRRGDIIAGEGHRLTVLHPFEGYSSGGGNRYRERNNNSLVLRLEGQGMSVLFMSEAEKEAAREVSAMGDYIQCDVLSCDENRIRGGALRKFLDATGPSLVVSSGLREWNIEVPRGGKYLVTGRDGAVKVEARGNGPRVKRHRDYAIVETRELREEMRNFRRLLGGW